MPLLRSSERFTRPRWAAPAGATKRAVAVVLLLAASLLASVPLPEEVRRAVREGVRRGREGDVQTGGPIVVPVEILFGCGRK